LAVTGWARHAPLEAPADAMSDYPAMLAAVNHVEPVPRRVRGALAGEMVLDTTRARERLGLPGGCNIEARCAEFERAWMGSALGAANE